MVNERDPRLLRVEDMVRRLLRHKADANLSNALEKMHAAEVAQIFQHFLPEERQEAFSLVRNREHRASILTESDSHIVRELLEPVPNDDVVPLIKELDSDDARYILETLPEERSQEIVALLDAPETEAIQDMMAYLPETAGAIMTDSYVALPEELTVDEAIARVRKASEVDYIFYVYVIDSNGCLRGVITLRQLLLADPSKPLSEIMITNVWSENVHADQEHVARVVSRYNILAIPVVDDDNVLVGIITVDDVLDVIREEATEDILKMAGTHSYQDEVTSLSARRLAWIRLPWLFFSWLGGILAAQLIHQYSDQLSKIVALAAFMPVIIGMAGNVGTQSATIVVRGIATGRIDPKSWLRVISKEVTVGSLLGVCYGLLLGLLATYQFSSVAWLGFVVGLAICVVMMFSALLASVLPLVLHRFRVDPAVATGPFVTTGVDVLGLLIYFNIARWFLFS
ncbi:MAG: magnesium transporter [Nitrospinae bacterium]|nr:magnesium transporter [Nitrospinota bacterium]